MREGGKEKWGGKGGGRSVRGRGGKIVGNRERGEGTGIQWKNRRIRLEGEKGGDWHK